MVSNFKKGSPYDARKPLFWICLGIFVGWVGFQLPSAFSDARPTIFHWGVFAATLITFAMALYLGLSFFREKFPELAPIATSTASDDSTSRRRASSLEFLAELQSSLSGVVSEQNLVDWAGRRICKYLDLSHLVLLDIDDEAAMSRVIADYQTDDSPPIMGVFKMGDFASDEERKRLSSGLTMVINDTNETTRSPSSIANFNALSIRSLVNAPYRRNRKLTFMLTAIKATAHQWTDDEIEILRELASLIPLKRERLRAEAALRESESRFHDLANHIPQLAWMADATGSIFWYNQRWFDYTGTTFEEMQGWGWKSVHHADYVEQVVERFRHAIENVSPWEDTFPLRGKDGEYRWFLSRAHPILDEKGQVLRWFGTNTDVTETKLGEERMRNAAEAAGFGTVCADLESGTVTYSEQMGRLLGHLVGKTEVLTLRQALEWIHPEDQRDCIQRYKQLAKGAPDSSHSIEHRVVRSDGSVRWVRLHAKPVFSGQGDQVRVSQLVGTVIDITQQREYEESIQLARKEAEFANQSKSEFLANMSHEIRTPMTAILGYADLIAEKQNDPETAEHVRTIRRNGDFLLDIINDILDLSKIEAGKFEIFRRQFSPYQLVEEVRSFMEIRATDSQIDLNVEYLGPIPEFIQSDPKRLRQILINLVGNAIKFTPRGSVDISVRFLDETEELQFVVADSGIGISETQSLRLFKPFSQGDGTVNREFGGTGLGLAISKRLTDMLGGAISMQSELGKGSKFTFTVATGKVDSLLEVDAKTSTLVTETHDSRNIVNLKCHVLIVDDRRDIRFLTKRFLTDAGAKVSEAEDGEVAVQLVSVSMKKELEYDLILLDMQMPKLDGYATAKALRRLGFANPIVALTADAMQGDMTRCIESGCNDYLSKPIDKTALLRKVSLYVQDGNRPC